jgi:hypothetical protein
MVVLLVLFTLVLFLTIDWFKTHGLKHKVFVFRGTQITTPGFEFLGALAQDGGKQVALKIKTEEDESGVVVKIDGAYDGFKDESHIPLRKLR